MLLITVKLPKNPDHDPHNKQTGFCPVSAGQTCSDVTGEHHTVLWESRSVEEALDHWRGRGFHVTRVEETLV